MELTRERDSLRSRVPPTVPDAPSNTLAGPAGRVFRSDGNTHRRSRFRSSTDARPVHTMLIGRRSGSVASAVRVVAHRCGFRGCCVGDRRRRRLRPLPWSWDSDSESDADPRPSCDGALRTQVGSCSDVPLELLDAVEHDLTMEVPRRRVKRAFNNDETTPIVPTGRFHVFSSEDEHRHMISSVDEPLIPSNRVDLPVSVTQPPSGLLPTWVDAGDASHEGPLKPERRT